jgi:hypothetical protein
MFSVQYIYTNPWERENVGEVKKLVPKWCRLEVNKGVALKAIYNFQCCSGKA